MDRDVIEAELQKLEEFLPDMRPDDRAAVETIIARIREAAGLGPTDDSG